MYWQIRGAVLLYTHQKKKQSKYKRENHSIHSIDAHEGWRKEKVIPVGT